MGKTPPHIIERNRRWREANATYMRDYSARRRCEPGWKRAKHLWQRYGLTLDQWDAMLIEQAGRCGICDEQMVDAIAVDHCHETGKVRGLLCYGCNSFLGYFERGLAPAAERYLAR